LLLLVHVVGVQLHQLLLVHRVLHHRLVDLIHGLLVLRHVLGHVLGHILEDLDRLGVDHRPIRLDVGLELRVAHHLLGPHHLLRRVRLALHLHHQFLIELILLVSRDLLLDLLLPLALVVVNHDDSAVHLWEAQLHIFL